jgi:hypothetical protein
MVIGRMAITNEQHRSPISLILSSSVRCAVGLERDHTECA